MKKTFMAKKLLFLFPGDSVIEDPAVADEMVRRVKEDERPRAEKARELLDRMKE